LWGFLADISGDIPIIALNKEKSKGFDKINGKTPFIIREI